MALYVGTKIIRAFPQDEISFLESQGKEVNPKQENRAGYKVFYPDGYVAWSPKEVFESAYRLVTVGELNLIEKPKEP